MKTTAEWIKTLVELGCCPLGHKAATTTRIGQKHPVPGYAANRHGIPIDDAVRIARLWDSWYLGASPLCTCGARAVEAAVTLGILKEKT